MRAHAVGHRLNQGGAATGAGTLHGFVQPGIHLLKIIAVNPVGGHAVPLHPSRRYLPRASAGIRGLR